MGHQLPLASIQLATFTDLTTVPRWLIFEILLKNKEICHVFILVEKSVSKTQISLRSGRARISENGFYPVFIEKYDRVF